MVTALLVPMHNLPKSGARFASFIDTVGVGQGDPASSTIFNLVMDKLLAHSDSPPDSRRVDSTAEDCINIYVDDAIALSSSPSGLQNLLRLCDSWAASMGMT